MLNIKRFLGWKSNGFKHGSGKGFLVRLYVIGFVSFVASLIFINDIQHGIIRINDYKLLNYNSMAKAVITGQSNGGRWLYYGIEWKDQNGQIHRGANKLPIREHEIGDTVIIKYESSNPSNFIWDEYSEIYHPLRNAILLFVAAFCFVISCGYLIYLSHKDKMKFNKVVNKFFGESNSLL